MNKRGDNLKGIPAILFFISMVIAIVVSPVLGFPASWVSTGGPLGGLGYDVRIHR